MFKTAEVLRNYIDEIEDPRKIDHSRQEGRLEAAPRTITWGEAISPATSYCPAGHARTLDNTYFWKNRRWCRKCREARDQGRRRG